MTLALVVVAALFLLLLLGRVAGARRTLLVQRWPSVVLALAALFAVFRGQVWFAIGLAGAAIIAWALAPQQRPAGARSAPAPNRDDATARAILGVSSNATAEEIRAAYRSKMAQAHPDLGGTHAAAAQLTAARDRLLKR